MPKRQGQGNRKNSGRGGETVKVTYTIVSDTVTPDLKARLARVSNPEPALRWMGLVLANSAKQAFRDPSKRPAPWAPLKQTTVERKKKKGYGSKELIASGALARSPRVIAASRTEVTVGSDRAAGPWSLAAIHQLGAPRRGIPARPFFPFLNGQTTPEARKAVGEVLKKWLNGKG